MRQTGKRIITIMILVAVLCCTFLYSSAESPAENAVLHLEAEDGTFFGNVKAKQSSGTGWVEGFRSVGDSFQLLLSVEKDGSYDLEKDELPAPDSTDITLFDRRRFLLLCVRGRESEHLNTPGR